MTLEQLWKSGAFTRTKSFVEAIACQVQQNWIDRLKNFSPSWWGRMALSTGPGGGGGILMQPIAGGIRVHYANKGAYDYMSVITQGRPPYSIKEALLRSKRARSSTNGGRYIIIPMTSNEDGSKVGPGPEVGSVLRTTGQAKDEHGQPRRQYRTVDMRSIGGDITAMQQGPVRGGRMQYSHMKFVVVSSASSGWMHPAIQADPIPQDLQKQANTAMKSSELKKALKADLKELLPSLLGKKR